MQLCGAVAVPKRHHVFSFPRLRIRLLASGVAKSGICHQAATENATSLVDAFDWISSQPAHPARDYISGALSQRECEMLSYCGFGKEIDRAYSDICDIIASQLPVASDPYAWMRSEVVVDSSATVTENHLSFITSEIGKKYPRVVLVYLPSH